MAPHDKPLSPAPDDVVNLSIRTEMGVSWVNFFSGKIQPHCNEPYCSVSPPKQRIIDGLPVWTVGKPYKILLDNPVSFPPGVAFNTAQNLDDPATRVIRFEMPDDNIVNGFRIEKNWLGFFCMTPAKEEVHRADTLNDAVSWALCSKPRNPEFDAGIPMPV